MSAIKSIEIMMLGHQGITQPAVWREYQKGFTEFPMNITVIAPEEYRDNVKSQDFNFIPMNSTTWGSFSIVFTTMTSFITRSDQLQLAHDVSLSSSLKSGMSKRKSISKRIFILVSGDSIPFKTATNLQAYIKNMFITQDLDVITQEGCQWFLCTEDIIGKFKKWILFPNIFELWKFCLKKFHEKVQYPDTTFMLPILKTVQKEKKLNDKIMINIFPKGNIAVSPFTFETYDSLVVSEIGCATLPAYLYYLKTNPNPALKNLFFFRKVSAEVKFPRKRWPWNNLGNPGETDCPRQLAQSSTKFANTSFRKSQASRGLAHRVLEIIESAITKETKEELVHRAILSNFVEQDFLTSIDTLRQQQVRNALQARKALQSQRAKRAQQQQAQQRQHARMIAEYFEELPWYLRLFPPMYRRQTR